MGGLRVERVRDFGEVYLALALWRRLADRAEKIADRALDKIDS